MNCPDCNNIETTVEEFIATIYRCVVKEKGGDS